MATVYLPLGYPNVQGAVFDTIIFQGTVAKRYTIPKDPRTDSQVMARKLLSDVAKMRGSAGAWAKSAWRITFGSKWGSIVYQMVKADVDSLWTNALDDFDNFSEAQQEAWDISAPYQVTFNKPGRVFYALAKMLWVWDDAHNGHLFYQSEPVAAGATEMAAWWTAGLDRYGWQTVSPTGYFVDDRDSRWTFYGAWSDWVGPGPLNSTLKQSSANGDYALVTVNSSWVRVAYAKNTDCGTFKVYINGAEAANINANGALTWQLYWVDLYREHGSYQVKILNTGSAGAKLDLDGLAVWEVYMFWDVDVVVGTWQNFWTGSPTELRYYQTTGSNEARIEFNIVAAWLQIGFRKMPTYGIMEVWVDGVKVDEIDQYAVSEIYTNKLVGRFSFGLHRVMLKKKGNGQISVTEFYPLRSKG